MYNTQVQVLDRAQLLTSLHMCLALPYMSTVIWNLDGGVLTSSGWVSAPGLGSAHQLRGWPQVKEEDTEDMEEDPATPKAGAEASTDAAAASKVSTQASLLPQRPGPCSVCMMSWVAGPPIAHPTTHLHPSPEPAWQLAAACWVSRLLVLLLCMFSAGCWAPCSFLAGHLLELHLRPWLRFQGVVHAVVQGLS